jgi:hypothetical protein
MWVPHVSVQWEGGEVPFRVRKLTGRGPASVREGRSRRTGSGLRPDGPWAETVARLDGFPAAFFLFLISFPFLFLFSLFISILLQICFKSNQTTF